MVVFIICFFVFVIFLVTRGLWLDLYQLKIKPVNWLNKTRLTYRVNQESG
jgi:hypothetical protein